MGGCSGSIGWGEEGLRRSLPSSPAWQCPRVVVPAPRVPLWRAFVNSSWWAGEAGVASTAPPSLSQGCLVSRPRRACSEGKWPKRITEENHPHGLGVRAALELSLLLPLPHVPRLYPVWGSTGRVGGDAWAGGCLPPAGAFFFFCMCGCFYNFDKSSSVTKAPVAVVGAGGGEWGKKGGAEPLAPSLSLSPSPCPHLLCCHCTRGRCAPTLEQQGHRTEDGDSSVGPSPSCFPPPCPPHCALAAPPWVEQGRAGSR